MRLKHIKLAGFKSFVDPTKVHFEQQMTAIVGPNGCGKSNIIDAVRWVLGESSAKNLRGEAMTDVIFNGAASRKPIGQASVELVFDNTQGRIQGDMADRSQVSVRRVVNRESINTYFLNGTKCRRRDITDIFLGTGLGPRSYAIIEQGTISRLIESKPQELRVFLEEAAGISKYKERRKETETRIRHTRENLARLSDIRLELDVQIDKLHQQAEAAKRFRTLKQQERKYKAELAVLRWQKFDQQRQQHQTRILALESKVESQNAELSQNDLVMIELKASMQACNDNNQTLHQQKLNVTQNIARAEQQVKYLKEQSEKSQTDNELTQQQLLNAQQLILTEQAQLQLFNTQLNEQQPQLQATEAALKTCQTALAQQQVEQKELQSQWQQHQQKRDKNQQQKLTIHAHITQQQTIIEQVSQQSIKLHQQITLLPRQDPAAEQALGQQKTRVTGAIEQLQKQQDQITDKAASLQQVSRELSQTLAVAAGQHTVKSQVIEALQIKLADTSPWSEKQALWFSQQNITDVVSLQSQLDVALGWEQAVEVVLSHWLAGHVIETLPNADTDGNLAADNLCFVYRHSAESLAQSPDQSSAQSMDKHNIALSTIKANTLANKVSGVSALTSYFNTIFLAENYREAKQELSNVASHQSIICPDGTWLHHHMLTKGKIEQGYDYISLQRQLASEQTAIQDLSSRQQNTEQQQSQTSEQQARLASEKSAISQNISLKHAKLNELNNLISLKAQASEQQQSQQQKLTEQIDDLLNSEHIAKQKLADFQAQITQVSDDSGDSVDNFSEQQTRLQASIEQIQTRSQTLHQQRHQSSLVVEQLKNQRMQGEQSIRSNQENVNLLTQRLSSNSQVFTDNSQPIQEFEQQLPEWLDNLVAINDKLQFNQQTLNDSQTRLATLELQQKSSQNKISALNQQLARLQLDSEGFKLRAESTLETLAELQQNIASVIEAMPANAKESLWQAQLIKLAKDIQLLGAINLAAIEEYESQFKRKSYLDQQDQDLNNAISTLEAAIAKIDKESRHKFKLTFDQVNKDLQVLFPKVFGGGQAYLTLTGEDLLETGVTIMARPPGKKNSTIHLLSGGEKALTALSLVFAIFRLNPAPFCLLDEVDAPLDDANVSRFCNLVREMSQTVQFIYISHNKIAMEMASHLTGVTMFEPGVSRMVAVDIDEAIAMAEV
ncbi:chromosome segregation protein SMC [Colwellia sp. MB3u-70]|uniref:chromosome segregation protein SMC n=1 Tax=unclassified Colwellia TaxID=196834 RepID=UPI0015F50DE7|nr:MULTISPECIES: chromosome segregation protein SMC [unclassified Colwellia]MBA6291089.1 chromosome segregation protein SMC [Colwellia sp. MB3u-8]MBA6308192.1 chromosome segregation protein SMC [Colwellia sp. MB3u-70]